MRSTNGRRRAAWIYVAASVLVIAFQIALALGAPWGELTMGGAYRGQLPVGMRVAAVGSAVLLLGFCTVVASHVHIAFPALRRASRWLIWIVVAYGAIGVVLNAVTPSPRERMLWLPVAIVLAVCAMVVARSKD